MKYTMHFIPGECAGDRARIPSSADERAIRSRPGSRSRPYLFASGPIVRDEPPTTKLGAACPPS